MKDRLLELQTKGANIPSSGKGSIENPQNKQNAVKLKVERETQKLQNKEHIEPLLPLTSDTSAHSKLVKFGEREKSIKEILWLLQSELEELKILHNALLSSASNDTDARAKADQLIKQITAKLTKVGNQIKEFNKTAQDKHKANKLSDTEHRIVSNVHNSLMNDFRMVMEELNNVRNSYEERSKKRIMRQLEIAGYPVDEREAEDALANGTPIFLREFAECEAAKLALRDLQDRHNELIQIEKSIAEVNQLFTEFSLMVATQGELIDNIERNVTGAMSSVEDGKTQLAEAKTKQRSARRKKIICSAIAVTVVIILAIVVIVQFV